jgi:matrixin
MDGIATPGRAWPARSRALLGLAFAITLAALAPAAVGAAASAGPPPAIRFGVSGPAVSTAEAIAARQWGTAACHGSVAIAWVPQAAQVNATSTWSNPWDFYANPQDNEACRVDFNTTAFFDWPKFCTVLVHELGHLTGHRHSATPSDVMYPYYSRPLAACAATPDPTAPPARPTPVATPVAKPKPAPKPAAKPVVRAPQKAPAPKPAARRAAKRR